MNIEDIGQPVKQKIAWAIQRQWLDNFALETREHSGKKVVHEFMWSCFTWGQDKALYGQKAKNTYLNQTIEPYYILSEKAKHCFLCNTDKYPDLEKMNSKLGSDWYLMPESAKWTFVKDHEGVLYYAEKSA